MSAIADFRIIETATLNELVDAAEIKVEKKLFTKKVIDSYPEYLNSISKELIDFQWSGYIFADLLVFLSEKKGIDLLSSEYDAIANVIAERRNNSTVILTYDHRKRYFDSLSPEKFTREELITFNKEFSEQDDPELAQGELAGIDALRKSLSLLTDNTHVILLSVI